MNKSKINSAVILCGGKGTRLGAIGKKIPKCLIKIKNKPILWYIINILKINSFNHFILPIGYKGELIRRFIKKDKNLKKLNIQIVNTGVDTNIARTNNMIFFCSKKILNFEITINDIIANTTGIEEGLEANNKNIIIKNSK